MKLTIKTILLSLVAVAVVVIGSGIYYVETRYLGIGLPWTTQIDLPEFPEYPAPVSELSEEQQGVIYYPGKSPYTMVEMLGDYNNSLDTTLKGTLFLPPGASAENPVPAMVIVHGSGGIREEREMAYGKWFSERNIAGFVIDYYEPRGVSLDVNYLRKVSAATEVDLVSDAYSALKILNTHPAINHQKIGVIGYSYGGMLARYTLDPRFHQIIAPQVPPFAAHVSVYGPCHQTLGSDLTTGSPYLSVVGDKDNSVDIAACDRVESVLEQNGTSVVSHVIEGAGHAWDSHAELKVYDNPYVQGCDFSYNDAGLQTINGEVFDGYSPDATRDELAYARSSVMIKVPECIGQGYLIGKDTASDQKAKSYIEAFVKRAFEPG